jgi:hypothetical protein
LGGLGRFDDVDGGFCTDYQRGPLTREFLVRFLIKAPTSNLAHTGQKQHVIIGGIGNLLNLSQVREIASDTSHSGVRSLP